MEWLSKKKMAEKIDKSEMTLDRWRKLGCPCRKFAGSVQFNPESVEKWALENPQYFQAGRPAKSE